MILTRPGTTLEPKLQFKGEIRPILTPLTPGGQFMKSKIIENVLRCPDLTHKVDKKCSDMILNRQRYDYRAKSAIFWVN